MSKKSATIESLPTGAPTVERRRLEPLAAPPLFDAGTVITSAAAAEAAVNTRLDTDKLLVRHLAGEWSQIPREAAARNVIAMRTGGIVRSAYLSTRASGIIFQIETDLRRHETTVRLQSECLSEPPGLPASWNDSGIKEILRQEDDVRAELATLTQAINPSELADAEHAADRANADLERVLLDEVLGKDIAQALVDAERERDRATAEHARLSAKAQAVQARIVTRTDQLAQLGKKRQELERAFTEAQRRREQRLLVLITEHDRDGVAVGTLVHQLSSLLQKIKRRRVELEQLGAHLNPEYFSGAGRALEAVARDASEEPWDSNLWQS